MKGLLLLPLVLLHLLTVPARAAIPVKRVPVPVQETSPDKGVSAEEVRQAEIDDLVRKLAAMGVDLKRPVDKDPSPPSGSQANNPLYTKKSVRTMSLGDLLDYQDQLRAHLTKLEDKERKAKEKDRLQAKIREERAGKDQADKQYATRQLREVEAELGDILIRRAMKGVGKMVPVPKFSEYEKEQAEHSSGHTDSEGKGQGYPNEGYSNEEYPDHEYIDYEIDAPVAITGKPAKKIRIKARRGVMELHQQIQDLNRALIDDAKRLIGKPF